MHDWRSPLKAGLVIPACPLPLFEDGSWSDRHQRAIVRYYIAAGAGGLAVGVHSTQFAIRDPEHGLYEPVLRLAAETIDEETSSRNVPFLKIAGICGRTDQAVQEAALAADLGYHAGLLSLTAFPSDPEEKMLSHCRAVGKILPIVGFYLQPAVGGRVLGESFWRAFAEIESVAAIKIAPFNRYQTLDVIRAVADAGRDDIALYTGNDDQIIADLLTPFHLGGTTRRIVGGLLGQWGVWTKAAVEMFEQIKQIREASTIPSDWLTRNAQLTDANAALFDAANDFRGCIPGIMEILRRQGLSPSVRCLDETEVLSPGQAEALNRVIKSYPWLIDDEFVQTHRDQWLS